MEAVGKSDEQEYLLGIGGVLLLRLGIKKDATI